MRYWIAIIAAPVGFYVSLYVFGLLIEQIDPAAPSFRERWDRFHRKP